MLKSPRNLVAIASLLGMAYCHIEDVGMKFEEHVYYMAFLFLGNIVASLVLIPAIVIAQRRSEKAVRVVYGAAGGLALMTIIGFVWSRTIGFPQMADHIGEWDRLGLSSLVFEGAIALISAGVLLRVRIHRAVAVGASIGLVGVALTASGALAHETMMMLGDPGPYPHVSRATPHQLAAAERLRQATAANAVRFEDTGQAAALGYMFDPREDQTIGFPGLRHMRMNGDAHYSGRLLDAHAPQSLVYWCIAPGQCKLTAFMYRAPGNSRPPTYGPLLAWHKHHPKATWMTHVWLTGHLRTALARCAPWPALQKALGIHERPWREDVAIDMACPTHRGHMTPGHGM